MFTLRRGLFVAIHLTGIPEPIDMMSNKTDNSTPFLFKKNSNMKKLFFAIMLLVGMTASAQTKSSIDSLIQEVHALRQELHETDSIIALYFDGIYMNIDKPRFKIYQTENTYNLLKVDTRTGSVWQVQYRMKGVSAQTVPINYMGSLGVVRDEDGWDGRFELYPTKNMYTFILIDSGSGATFQVQWGTEPDYRFMERLY